MKDCISKRLKGKLAMTPYNSERAHAEFSFIDKSFCPMGRADVNEHEGCIQDEASITETVPKDRPNGISVHIPIPMSLHLSQKAPDETQHRAPLTEELNTHINTPLATPNVLALVPCIKLLPPKKTEKNKPAKLPINAESINEETDDDGKCTFCPTELCDCHHSGGVTPMCAPTDPRVLSPGTSRHMRMGCEANVSVLLQT